MKATTGDTQERESSAGAGMCVAKDTRTTSVVHMNVVSFMIIQKSYWR